MQHVAPSGALALALLLSAAPAAYADGGARHGGRRAPPPPPPSSQPSWVGQPVSRPRPTELPSAARVRAATPVENVSSVRRQTALPSTFQRPAPALAPRVQAPAVPAFQRSLPTTHQARTRQALPGSEALAAPSRRIAAPATTVPIAPGTTRPLVGTSPSPRRDSLAPASGMLAPGPRAALPSTWVSARERLRSDATVRHGGTARAGVNYARSASGVRHAGGATAYHAGTLPTHVGGVRYAPRGYYGGGYYPSPVFAPTWGWHRPTTFVSFGLWGFGCCCPEPVYVEPYYPAPVYVEPSYPTPGYAEPTYVPPTPAPQPYATAPEAPVEPSSPWPAPSQEPAAPAEAEGTPRQPTAEQQEAIRRSLDAFQAERPAEALALLEAAVAADAEFGDAWLGIAYASWALERYDRAAVAVTRAAVLGAFPRGYRFDPAPLFARPEALRAARARLDARVVQAPRDADARLVLAWLLVSAGERVPAQEQIQQVLTLRPADEAAPLLAIALLPPPSAPESTAPTGR